MLISTEVMRLQAGHLAEMYVDKGVQPITEAEVAEAQAWLDTTLAVDVLYRQTSSDLTQALVYLRPHFPKDQIVAEFMTHQRAVERWLKLPLIESWIWRVSTKLEFCKTGLLSNDEAWAVVGEDMMPTIEDMRVVLDNKRDAAIARARDGISPPV